MGKVISQTYLAGLTETLPVIVDWLVVSTLILLMAGLLNFFLARKSPSFRNANWRMAFVALALLPLLQWLGPELGIAIPISLNESLANSSLAFMPSMTNLLVWLALLYCMGAAFNLFKLTSDIRAVMRSSTNCQPCENPELAAQLAELRQRNGVTQPVSLSLSSAVKSPSTWGVFKHRIILPTAAQNWEPVSSQCVLGHELGHIARNDWFFYVLSRLVASLYWFNPLAWSALARLEAEAEKSCDDIAIDDSGCQFAYAECLVSMAQTMLPGASKYKPGMLGNAHQLTQRINHILHPQADRHHIPRESFLPYLFTAVVLTCCLSSLHFNFQTKEDSQLPGLLIPVHFVPANSDEFDLLMSGQAVRRPSQ